jgi:WS/DGAT/MGAT family acyltransferase
MLSSGMERTSNTPINQPIGPHRRFDWIAMDMDRIKAIRHVSGSSINDVVLAIATGAIRSFLQRNRHMSVEDLDFRVMAPVSVRREDEQDGMGNHVSAWIVRLPIAEPEPLVRLQTIRETTAELKRTRQAQGAEILTEAVAWTGPAFLSLGSRLMSLGQPFNLVVTNVPGPPFPLYLLESRMLEVIPMVPLMGTLTTGIALFSYDGQLYWGVIADRDRVPDLHDLVLALDEAFEELANAAKGATSEPGAD